ncbi:response regulator [Streptomyces gamaensis]|uniref:Response regulator n=1 Tax=Streptomyces gamaensis TaxID=1763542 RepID=A0ABW0Z1D5_9ACTN
MTVRVLVADAQAIARSGLRMMVRASDDFVVAGEAADGAEAIMQARLWEPDIVLMDLRMPGGLDGIRTLRVLRDLPSPPRVLVIGTTADEEQVLEALDAGASGFLLKDLQCEELLSALRVVASGGQVFAPAVLGRLLRLAAHRPPDRITAAGSRLASLTGSERDVLRLIGAGMTNDEIARELHLAATSVKTYVSRTLAKLGLSNRTQAAVLAYRAGLIGGEGEEGAG